MSRLNRYAFLPLLTLLGLALAAAPARSEEDLPPMVELVGPDERDGDAALREAEEAARHSHLQLTVQGVGFDLRPGSRAEVFLQELSEAGSGHYYSASTQGEELVLAVSAAVAGDPPAGGQEVSIHSPHEGEIVGPSVVVEGRSVPGEVLVIYTVAYRTDTGEQVRNVPGTRQRVRDDGEFSFRIATPRISFGEVETQIRYEIRAHILREGGYKGPETIVNVFSPTP